MSVIAQVVDGQIVESSSQASLKSESTSKGSTMDKEAFLQLLVAQMKYQDPLEPTSNTETVSQYAQFAQVESIQNMSSTMELQRASSMVGQEVYVKATGKNGESTLLQGKVEYVVYENGKPYLAINESLYSLEDLYTVADKEYLAAYEKATDWVNTLNRLPHVESISIAADGETIDKLKDIYDKMTDYEKTFIAKEKAETLEKYVEKLEQLRKIAGDKDDTGSGEETPGTGDTEGGATEGAGSTDGAGDNNEDTGK